MKQKTKRFCKFFKNNLTDKRYDSLGLIGAGVLCCVLSGAMGIVGIIFVAIGIFLSFSNINLVKLVEKLSKKQSKVPTTVNNETQKSQATSVTNEPTEAKETKDWGKTTILTEERMRENFKNLGVVVVYHSLHDPHKRPIKWYKEDWVVSHFIMVALIM